MTGSTKIVFHAFSAFVGSLKGRTTCAFWTDDPADGGINWDPKRLVDVDLSKTPSAARAGQISWDQVDVDDHTSAGGLTTLGPLFPSTNVIGALWLSESFMKRNNLTEAHKPQHAHGHELRSLLYVDAGKERRYQGFHAKLAGGGPATTGSQKVTRVQVWNAGAGKGGGHSGMWWLDLDDIADMTESDVGSKGAAEGSLYLDSDKKKVFLAGGGTGPKVPPAHGY